MNRKILSLITILCIFTVSLLGQVAYASEVDYTNDQVTIKSTYDISWDEMPGAVSYKVSCREFENNTPGLSICDNVNVGSDTSFTITSKRFIPGMYYRVYITGHDASGKKVGYDYQFFTY